MPIQSRIFIDSNILLYAVDRSDEKRRSVARRLIRDLMKSGAGVVSTQAAQEFYVIATKKLSVSPLAAKRMLEMLYHFEFITTDLDLIFNAIDCSILSKISFWDALIVSTARASGCKQVWSEYLNHSQIINGVRITNPFL